MTPSRPARADYRHFVTYPTRWRDNDAYGHMNNAVFYEYADTLVNGWLRSSGGLGVPDGPVVCVVAETGCVFHAGLGFPEPVEAGLGLERAGRSSIVYRVGLFRPGEDGAAAAIRFVHVCVERAGRRPVAIPAGLRRALEELS
jgi:acyl-CoA thioester hydrolase